MAEREDLASVVRRIDAPGSAEGLPEISVIVPHYRDLAGLDACLDALGRQSYPRDRFEIIVADNASPEGPDELARTIAGRAAVIVVNERGAGPARNGGVTLAKNPILAFTDSDCRPQPDWLAHGVAALSHCDFVGGCMEVIVDDPSNMTPAEAFEAVFAFDNRKYVVEKGFTVTANLFCRRECFERTGGFRSGVSEDLDWSHRARDLGYKIGYAADAVVGHPARRTWSELQTKWRRMGAEAFGLAATKPGGRLWWFTRSLALPLSAFAHTPRVLTTPKLRTFRQRYDALGVLYRIRMWRFLYVLRLLASGGKS